MASTKNRKHHPITLDTLMAEKKPKDRSKEEMLELLKAFANDRKFKLVNRNAFREAGIPDSAWAKYFGTFPAFLEAAGLNTSAGTRKIHNQIAKHSRGDSIKDTSNKRLTWGDKYLKHDKGNRWKTILAASDIHDVEADEFAVRMFVEAATQIQPDVICINGDLFDLPEFSRHPKDPREYDLLGRLNYGLGFVAQLRLACPNAQIDLIEGNHEARMVKFLMTDAPAMSNLLSEFHGMDIRKLFRLDEYEVNYVAKGDLKAFTDAQLKKAVLSSDKVYWGALMARHHPPSQKHAVTMPGFNGHHHQHLTSTHYNPLIGSFEWHQTGGLHKRQASYTEADLRWNCGFIYGIVDTKYQRVNFQYTYVGDTGCQLGGQFYERKKAEFYPGLQFELDQYERVQPRK